MTFVFGMIFPPSWVEHSLKTNAMKNITTYLILIAFSLLTIACNEKSVHEHLGTSILDTMSSEKLLSGGTRSFGKEQAKDVTTKFTVVYSGDLVDMMNNPESSLKALIESYNLKVESPFEIDEENKGIVLVSSSKLTNPVAVGKEISLVTEVLMVEVGGVSSSQDQAS